MDKKILLDAGSGGRASQRLVQDLFLGHFGNDILDAMNDAAILPPMTGHMAMSTDSYTVSPIFFPGGSIGALAVNGTVNDVAMMGARPIWLSCGFVLEEGLALSDLERIVADMALACKKAGVRIVTGDTKVVPSGACDKVFINTAGLGEVYASPRPAGNMARPGDVVIVSGTMGDHGLTIMAARENLSFLSEVRSDCAPLADMAADIMSAAGEVHVLRDPTRGGLATTLNEIAEQSGVCIEIEEAAIPVNPLVVDGCSFLGLDPLYLANEGKCICILPADLADKALAAMRHSPHGRDAAAIGTVTDERPGKVLLHTRIGGSRFLGMLEGAQLPRIC